MLITLYLVSIKQNIVFHNYRLNLKDIIHLYTQVDSVVQVFVCWIRECYICLGIVKLKYTVLLQLYITKKGLGLHLFLKHTHPFTLSSPLFILFTHFSSLPFPTIIFHLYLTLLILFNSLLYLKLQSFIIIAIIAIIMKLQI